MRKEGGMIRGDKTIAYGDHERANVHSRTIDVDFEVLCEECGAKITSMVVGEFPVNFDIKIQPHTCAVEEEAA